MKSSWEILIWLLLMVLCVPCWAASGHYALRAELVATALSGMGREIAPEQVMLMSDVVATSATPKLRVRSAEKWGDHRLMVRMECENPQECVPFMVGLQLGKSSDAQNTASNLQSVTGTTTRPSLKSYVVRAGMQTTLMLDGERVHIRIPVVCLENGVPGQKVRARSSDRKQVYTAEVVDATLLKGRL